MTEAVGGSGEPAPWRPEGGPVGAPLAVPNALGALWAVRHGQSTANVAFAGPGAVRLEGRDRDVPLSALGQAQARALGHWLVEHAGELDLVVCSPYVRARQTWQAMAGYEAGEGVAPLPLLVDERLRDREMGVFELYPPAALAARDPEEAARRDRLGEWFYRPPGGESLADVALRVRGCVADLERAAPGRRVLLVAHDATVVAVRFALAGLGAAAPEDVPPVPNASLSHWQGDGDHLSLRLWGGTAHLERDTTA